MKEFFFWLLLQILAFGIFFGLFLFIIWIKDRVDHIPSSFRWLLVLPYALLALTAVDGGLRTVGHILALFWPETHVGFNVYFGAFVLLPLIGSYTVVIASCIMAPALKVPIAYLVSIIWAGLYILNFYIDIDTGIPSLGDSRLLDFYSIDRGIIGSTLFLLSTFVGVYFAVNHAKSRTSFLDDL